MEDYLKANTNVDLKKKENEKVKLKYNVWNFKSYP